MINNLGEKCGTAYRVESEYFTVKGIPNCFSFNQFNFN